MVDELDFGFGWISLHKPELQMASHAVVADEKVWLVDPNEGPAVPEQMASSETQTEMLRLLASLKPIEADILRKRFGLVNDKERTLKEIGDEYRLSRERVRQLQEQALGKMRRALQRKEMY